MISTLKQYQQNVIDNLNSFLESLSSSFSLNEAWSNYWQKQNLTVGNEIPYYRNIIKDVPHVCVKVPTGGGKTLISCAALKPITEYLGKVQLNNGHFVNRPIIYLVPSDAILQQTVKNLSNPDHDYRHWIDKDFAGKVEVFTKESLLTGQNFNPDTVKDMLCVSVFMYASLRIDSKKKDDRKIYQENGNLQKFAQFFDNHDLLLSDTDDTALINILRELNPILIVDESHNATSELSTQMLQNLNPAFVLDLTATPRDNANIISYVEARQLKAENMVKLPVFLDNKNSRDEVLASAIDCRNKLEEYALQEEDSDKNYIRPIVLFQAEPKTSADTETFDKVKAELMQMGIPENQIAIKTSGIDQLKNIDLLSPECPIRYIITVNALKEGWDCPFAYILASLANKTSTVDVEQILGRVLRQPYAQKHSEEVLNCAYVFTSSNDFHNTIDNVIKGLNVAGFGKNELATSKPKVVYEKREYTQNFDFYFGSENSDSNDTAQNTTISDTTENAQKNYSSQLANENFGTQRISDHTPNYGSSQNASSTADTNNAMENFLSAVSNATSQYAQSLSQNSAPQINAPQEVKEKMSIAKIKKQFEEKVKDLKIPQFTIKVQKGLFFDQINENLLEPRNLTENFLLSKLSSDITFNLSTEEVAKIDIEEKATYTTLTPKQIEYYKKRITSEPPAQKIETCIELLCTELSSQKEFETKDLQKYVRNIVENLNSEQLVAVSNNLQMYKTTIRNKILSQRDEFCKNEFFDWINKNKITSSPQFSFPEQLILDKAIDTLTKSLYTIENGNMNNFERKVIETIASLNNIDWWHRIIAKGEKYSAENNDFYINAYKNIYPDFILQTTNGTIVLVETKGDDRDNSDSKEKLKIGKAWKNCCNSNKYKYFMVFDKQEFAINGAYTFEKFIDVIKEL